MSRLDWARLRDQCVVAVCALALLWAASQVVGSQIAYGRPSYGLDLGELEIRIYNRNTQQTTTIPGSKGLFSPTLVT